MAHAFPDVLIPDADGLVFTGGTLTRETIVEAYTRGVFPWRGGRAIPWYSPDPRAVLRPGAMRVARSLAKRARHAGLAVAFDRDFRGTMVRCATTPRAHESSTWITDDMIDAYCELHAAGIAHSVEIYRADDHAPVGGLYGLTFGRLFHGESMYHLVADASKLALWCASEALAARGFTWVDCQVPTRHLMSLGAQAIPRAEYLASVRDNARWASLHESWAAWRVDHVLPPLG
ncbi:MAG TPA: leucyl/phenylalanyl-tRNA--protein transferase [Kofleriaceae bacterium]|nr:leucyl/phenylalanyl-tRNA--protein transferase [Kofleriaceae bacterium]